MEGSVVKGACSASTETTVWILSSWVKHRAESSLVTSLAQITSDSAGGSFSRQQGGQWQRKTQWPRHTCPNSHMFKTHGTCTCVCTHVHSATPNRTKWDFLYLLVKSLIFGLSPRTFNVTKTTMGLQMTQRLHFSCLIWLKVGNIYLFVLHPKWKKKKQLKKNHSQTLIQKSGPLSPHPRLTRGSAWRHTGVPGGRGWPQALASVQSGLASRGRLSSPTALSSIPYRCASTIYTVTTSISN